MLGITGAGSVSRDVRPHEAPRPFSCWCSRGVCNRCIHSALGGVPRPVSTTAKARLHRKLAHDRRVWFQRETVTASHESLDGLHRLGRRRHESAREARLSCPDLRSYQSVRPSQFPQFRRYTDGRTAIHARRVCLHGSDKRHIHSFLDAPRRARRVVPAL